MSSNGVQLEKAICHAYLLKKGEWEESISLDKDKAVARAGEEAYRAGFEEGRKAGIQIGRQERESQLRILQGMTQELHGKKKELLRGSESETLNLALAVAGKIMKEEVSNTGKVKELVKEAIGRALDEGSILIRLHPADLEEVESIKSELISSREGVKVLRLVGDSRVGRGGCLIETDSGNIDARLDRQLAEVKRAFGRMEG